MAHLTDATEYRRGIIELLAGAVLISFSPVFVKVADVEPTMAGFYRCSIGGVFLLSEGESESGVPGLRKIPGLGWLFKKKNITKENKELLIFLTPKIMS